MDYSSFDLFFSKIFLTWSESFYTKPILEIVALFCLFSIASVKRSLKLRKLAIIFCFSLFLFFFTLDLSYGFYFLIKPRFTFEQFVQYYEALNGLFTFVEFYVIYSIVNFGVDEKALKFSGKVLGVLLLVKEILFRFQIIRIQNMDMIQFNDELSSGISYGFFTLYLTYYYVILYKRNIMSTFVTPSACMIFCYVVLSLLFFPCSYYLIMQKNQVGYVFYAYHALLAAGICLVFRYNVLYHKSKEVNFLEFEI